GPDGRNLVRTFEVGHRRIFVLLAKLFDLLQSLIDDALLRGRRDHVVDTDRKARTRRVQEAHRLQIVKKSDGLLVSKLQVAESYERLQAFLLERSVDVRQAVTRQAFVKN